jgi:DNA-binding MarR family transcriptional regulator
VTLAHIAKWKNEGGHFRPQEYLAADCGLPLPTVRKHIAKLIDTGWIENRGREKAANKRTRRPVTLVTTAKWKRAVDQKQFIIMPTWLQRSEAFKAWSLRLVLSYIGTRVNGYLVKAEEESFHWTSYSSWPFLSPTDIADELQISWKTAQAAVQTALACRILRYDDSPGHFNIEPGYCLLQLKTATGELLGGNRQATFDDLPEAVQAGDWSLC